MHIQAINYNACASFKGKFEHSEALNKLTQVANDKDLMEFSLMLDVINSKKDGKIFYVKEKKPSFLDPDKGFILWCQEHWDSFPKPYKSCIIDNIDDKKQLVPILEKFTGILKSIYRVDFEKNVGSYFQKQIINKLA